ncbi:NAD(P)-dependent oxidoreductase [Pseudolysinimonas kribbensis]
MSGMRLLLAGGTGVIGRPLIPALVAAGHEVVATTRRPESLALLDDRGARGVVMDAFDADRVTAVVAEVAPDAILHELTDLGAGDRDANARLRREGTANLVAAAEAAGVDRMLVQSIAWLVQPGAAAATEDEPITPGVVADMERAVARLPHATVLRYGMLWGPSTWYPDAASARSLPGVGCWVHVDDVVSATVQALGWPDGTYNIVDDEPDPAGRAVSNARARAAGWRPRHPGRHDTMGG